MKKKELLQMPKLRATAYMMRLAREDEPKTAAYYYSTKTRYKREAYARCCIKNGIFKMAIFFPEYMRMGSTLPTYEIYVDKGEEQYLTYNRKTDKWMTASLNYTDLGYYYWHATMWCARETNKAIAKYFDTNRIGIQAVVEFQNKVLGEKLEQRHRRETDPWDEDMKQTRPVPKDWTEWASTEGVRQQYIFYHYTKKKNGQTGYCTHCKKEVPIKKPKYNQEGFCPHCRASVIYKSIGKFSRLCTDYYCVHLLQRCEDGVMLRQFYVRNVYCASDYKKVSADMYEDRRVICDKEGRPQRVYYYGRYKCKEYRWIRGEVDRVKQSYSFFYNYCYRSSKGKVYIRTLPDLAKHELKKTGFLEYCRQTSIVDPEHYLECVRKKPYLEKFAKVGLIKLFDECADGKSYSLKKSIDDTQNSLLKMLHIEAGQLKRLQECNGGCTFLRWLQYEKIRGRQIAIETMEWLCENDFKINDFDFLHDKMSVEQIHHYVVRQMQENNMKLRETLTTWSDYLAMAQRIGLDTNDEIIYRVRKLRQRHDELVEIVNSKDDAVRAGEILKKFPNLEQVLAEIKEKYEYSDENYTIIVPERIENIFSEGRKLHHCVSNEKYLERIATNESYIVFLRRAKEPEKAHYTLEVEPGGTIRQKRTMYDRQEKDIEEAKIFLHKWQREIALRMTKEDARLAKKSKRLRLREFSEMDKSNLLINTGHLQGQRLVDVLMADLMEAA